MENRLKRWIESVLYAGMRPSGQAKAAGPRPWLEQVKDRFERWAAGAAPTDPLYLSNRTWKQKARVAVAIGVPLVVLGAAVAVGLSNLIPRKTAPPREPTAAEIVARLLPDVEKRVKIDVNQDAELLEVRVDRGPAPRITGVLKNKTDRVITVEMVLDLTDEMGSRVGAVDGRVEKAAPGTGTAFQFPLAQKDAAFALVRELKTVK